MYIIFYVINLIVLLIILENRKVSWQVVIDNNSRPALNIYIFYNLYYLSIYIVIIICTETRIRFVTRDYDIILSKKQQRQRNARFSRS